MTFDPSVHPHRRFNPLRGEWVLVSPQRTQRPWQGQTERRMEARPSYDPQCYLCPGNSRAGGQRNPAYTSTHVFTNDFAALVPDAPGIGSEGSWFFRCQPVRGDCRVLCFSPRHDLTLPELDHAAVLKVIAGWRDQQRELGRRYRWVQIFENKGAMMGCSNPHPHGQIWASDTVPSEVEREDALQLEYFRQNDSSLLVDYLQCEIEHGERMVLENPHWSVVVPYWAAWPFEALLLPKRHVLRLTELNPPECGALAAILRAFLVRYDNLFQTSFPYSMGWHGAPSEGSDPIHWQLHAHFYPPLLRSATVRKFIVGYELLAEIQRDLTPETAAERLRSQSETHYRRGGTIVTSS